MIETGPNRYVVTTLADLDIIVSMLAGQTLGFMDLETTSDSKTEHSKNPWRHCRIAGIAITAGHATQGLPSYYMPIGHAPDLFGSANINRAAVLDCLRRVTATWTLWVNQSIKYDMHVLQNDLQWLPPCEVEDLLTLAKLENTDRFLYNLSVLSEEYRGVDIRHLEHKLKPYLQDNQDYGRIPIDVLGDYACEDVLAVREVFAVLDKLVSGELALIRGIERQVTAALYDCEQTGLRVDPHQLKVQQYAVGYEINLKIDNLSEAISFPGFNPNSNAHMNELFVNRLGLPVIKWTNEDDDDKTSNPSFGKESLAEYLVHPKAPIKVVQEVIEIRKLAKFYSGFLKPYGTWNVGGKVHASYNQLIRTGRMACREPNTQQLNKVAKQLILPDDGCAFLSVDQSQIEFRTIAHYIQDRRCIKAYNENPDTDFHQWVAIMAAVSRKNAKTVNFLMGYGGGKEKLISALIKDPDLVGSIKAEVDKMLADGVEYSLCEEYFKKKARSLAVGIYEDYHKTLPSLRRTATAASDKAREIGYVRTLYGRRRHLERDRSHIAFNSACQGTAADFIKDSVARLRPVLLSYGVSIVAIVHDEILFHGPIEAIESEDLLRDVLRIMEKPEPMQAFSVPVRCSYGTSRTSWLEATSQEKKYSLENSDWHPKNSV